MKRRRIIPTFGMSGRYAPGICLQPVKEDEESILVKVGLKKPETRECGRELVRFRGVKVCPVHTELVESVKKGPNGELEVERVPLEQVFPNRRARRAA